MPTYEVNGDVKKGSLQNSRAHIRSNAAQILAVCIKNMLLLSFGMTLGYPTILIPGLQLQDSDDSFGLSQETISWIGSVNLICVPVGCAVSGAITEVFGRKKTMQWVNVPFLAAWLIMKFSTSIYLIFLALCLTGLSGGLLEAPVITYVSEICQPRLRGMLSSTSTVAVISGILLQFLLGTFLHWRTVALVNCIFPVLSFTLLFIVPESPHWLILKNRYLDARKSIAWLRGWTSLEEIEPEFKDLCRYIANHENAPGIEAPNRTEIQTSTVIEKIKLYTKKNFLWPYALVSFCFFLGHFSGMSTLQTYAVQIFASLRSPINKYVATVYLGVAEVVGCIVCVLLIRRLGKRKLNFASLIGLGICFLVVAVYAHLIDVQQLVSLHSNNNNNSNSYNNSANNNSITNEEKMFSDEYSWVPLVFLILSAFLSHTGIRILPWILTGELYSNETRAAASGLSGAIGYVFGFLANKTFLILTQSLTLPGVFSFNSAVAFVGCVLLYVFLPETEGKPLQEITDHFRGLQKMRNSVRRKQKSNTNCQNGEVNDAYRLDNLEKGAQAENHM